MLNDIKIDNYISLDMNSLNDASTKKHFPQGRIKYFASIFLANIFFPGHHWKQTYYLGSTSVTNNFFSKRDLSVPLLSNGLPLTIHNLS